MPQTPASSSSTVGLFGQTAKRKLTDIMSSNKDQNDATNEENNEEIGKMSTSHLLGMMSALLDDKLKNLPSKSDILEIKENIIDVKAEVNRLADENKYLQEEINCLKKNREEDQKRMRRLEDDLGKRKILIKGLNSQRFAKDSVKKLFREKLKISNTVEIEYVWKLYEKDDKMTVLVELKSAEMVGEVFKNIKNLKDSAIYIERDLSAERRTDKKVLLQLKRDLLKLNQKKRINVINDKLKVEDKWFAWNREKALMCGRKSGEDELIKIFGNSVKNVSLNFKDIIEKIGSKNY